MRIFFRSLIRHEYCSTNTQVQKGENICSVGSWSLGSRVLDVCRTIMEFHPPCSIQKSLGKLLRFVSEHFDDIDVKDRARLYRNILIHVREPRLSRILDARVDAPSRREDVKDFVPRTNAKIRNVDIARVLELRRIGKDQRCEVVVSDVEIKDEEKELADVVFKQYEDALSNAVSAGISNTIHIPFRLNFHGGEDDLDKLYVEDRVFIYMFVLTNVCHTMKQIRIGSRVLSIS